MKLRPFLYVSLLLILYCIPIIGVNSLSHDTEVQRGVSLAGKNCERELNCIGKDIETILCKEKTVINKLDRCCFTLNSKIDVVNVDLNECCATLNSKLDVITQSITVVTTCDFSSIDSRIDACCDLLSSKIDDISCTATVSPACDFSSITSSIDQCCATLNSKLDLIVHNLTIDTTCDLSSVNSRIDVCCGLLSSKIDAITCNAACDSSSVSSKIDLCCFTLGSKVDAVDASVADCCFTIQSKLDTASLCAATIITGPTTLSLAGTYCLANDVTRPALASPNNQTILITGDNIIFDLNGHNVSNDGGAGNAGIRVSSSASEIIIRNGFVQKNSGTINTGTGILLEAGAHNIRIDPMYISSWDIGISISQVDSLVIADTDIHNNASNGILCALSTNIDIQRCLVNNNATGAGAFSGISLFGLGGIFTNNVTISDCKINSNGADLNDNGLEINNAHNIRVYNTTFDQNTGTGILIINDSSGVEICKCSANQLIIPPTAPIAGTRGFFANGHRNIFISDCTAYGFDRGFSGNDGAGLNILNCVAKGNLTGFFLATGSGIMRGNTADNNEVGFSNTGSYNFYSNVSCQNTINYSGTFSSAVVTSSNNAQAFDNVDCANTTPNVIQSTLDMCCTQLNSKLDNFACNVSVSATCDLAGTFTVLNTILSNESTIESKLDLCCAQLNSKLDNFACNVSVSATCDLAGTFTVLNTILSNENTIESKLDLCCAQLNSKLDSITLNVNCDFSTVESKLDRCCNTLQSTIDALDIEIDQCCFTLNSKVDTVAALSVLLSDGIGTVIGNENTLASKLDVCCSKIESDIFNLTINSTCDLSSTITAIESCCSTLNSKIDLIMISSVTCSTSCAAIPLMQDDVITGSIIITAAGSYCLVENITGNITIAASDVTLNLNGHSLFGTIDVSSGSINVLIHSGNIKPLAPIDVNDANHAAVVISLDADKVNINNCYIVCTDSELLAALNGRSGIQNESNNLIVEDCFITTGTGGLQASATPQSTGGTGIINTGINTKIIETTIQSGDGGPGAFGGAAAVPGGNGGSGVINSANNMQIIHCTIYSGNGGNGGFLSSGGSSSLNVGGNAGTAINNAGQNLQVLQSTIITGNGGTGGNALTPGSQAAAGGLGGNGIISSNTNTEIIECSITTGNGGNGGPSFIGGNGGSGNNGGTGITNTGNNINIIKTIIDTGNGGFGSAGSVGAVGGTMGGNGGNAGTGIINDGSLGTILETVINTGLGGNGGNNAIGLGGSGPAAGNGGSGGLGIINSGSQTQISQTKIVTSAGGNGGLATGSSSTGGNGGDSGIAITNSGSNVEILSCVLDTGNGGVGNISTGVTGNGGTAGNGANGINNSGSNIQISLCIITTGTGGQGGNGNQIAGNGGNGGIAINQLSANNGKIRDCSIKQTGAGGAGGAGGIAGANGSGGDGIRIDSGATDSDISTCIITKTGLDGSGTPNANGGLAINDMTLTSTEIIYSNVAFQIAHTPNKYLLAAGAAIDSPFGTAFGPGTDRLSNIFKP